MHPIWAAHPRTHLSTEYPPPGPGIYGHHPDCAFVKMVPKHNQDYSGTALPMDQKRRFVAPFRVQKHLHIK